MEQNGVQRMNQGVFIVVGIAIVLALSFGVLFEPEKTYGHDTPEETFHSYFEAINDDERVIVIGLTTDRFSSKYDLSVNDSYAWGWVYYLNITEIEIVGEIDKSNYTEEEIGFIMRDINETEEDYSISIEDYSLVHFRIYVENNYFRNEYDVEIRRACYKIDSLWYLSQLEFKPL